MSNAREIAEKLHDSLYLEGYMVKRISVPMIESALISYGKQEREKAIEEAAERCESESSRILAYISPEGIGKAMSDACKHCADGIRALKGDAK